jgi:diguanylate cyclase (GGDEF)-like protein/hemerythrin-like metal-binding protein
MMIIDLDHFKNINDRFGHDVGDRVLIEIVNLIQTTIRTSDKAFRWGGEEFMILLPHTTLASAKQAAEKIRLAIANHRFTEVGKVTVSLGVAEHYHYEPKDIWFKRCDICLYRAKQSGRNAEVCWEDDDKLPLAMVKIDWQVQWNSGNPVIDFEHRELLEIGNRLIDLSLVSASQDELKTFFNLLADHVQTHFRNEEQILADIGYPDIENHRKSHNALLQVVGDISSNLEDDSINVVSIFNLVMGKIVLGHLLSTDVKYFPITQQLGRSAKAEGRAG